MKRVELEAERASRAGCLMLRRARSTKTLVGLYKAAEARLDEEGGPYVTVCEPHAGCVNHETLKDARDFLSHPEEWCSVCQGHDPAPED